MNSSSNVFGIIIGLGCLLGVALLCLMYYLGYKVSAKLSQSEGVRVLLTIVFGSIFNIALATAAVAGCIAIAGSPNFH
jgi:hypothetical protein